LLNVEDCVSRVPLREDCLFLGKGHDFPTLADSGKEFPWVELALFLGRFGWWHQRFHLRGATPLEILSKWCATKDVHFCSELLKTAAAE
jgi:hypothetical protein